MDTLELHGGPSSGCLPGHFELFDLSRFRVTCMDQHGCGRNTTHDLIADIERLRVHLGIDAWVLFGGAWGSTLAMVYVQAHPRRV